MSAQVKKVPRKKLPKKCPKKRAKAKPAPTNHDSKKAEDYQKIKEQSAQRRLDTSVVGRDIGAIPAIGNPNRRKKSKRSFRAFCEAYFPGTFTLKWSPDHLKVIRQMEDCVLHGGLFAVAMPRGFGKTSLCEILCVWAIVNGYKDFVALIAADLSAAREMMESIKTEFENNELLLMDFPEVCFPIQSLGGIYQRAGGQLCRGKPTNIGWTADEIIFPTIAGSAASGAVIRIAGINGRIRGMKHKKTGGESIRPGIVIIDDPQTDESARSPQQIQQRLDLLNGAILGLAGPKKKISGIMPCTVIFPNDMADRILNRENYPSWMGARGQILYEWPTNMDLWEEYVQIRKDSLLGGGKGAPATEFYKKNRKAMDAGCKIAWKEWYDPDEISAIQHAMNLRYRDNGERAFWSEYMNDPLPPDEEMVGSRIDPEVVLSKLTGSKRNLVPVNATNLTAFIDVQGEALFWIVVGWENNFSGSVIGYGTYPEQSVNYFTASNMPLTLTMATKTKSNLEARLYEGLTRLATSVIGKEWSVEGGGFMRINRCLVDANWGLSTDTVYRFCRQNELGAILVPSHGKFYGAASLPIGDSKRKRGERRGLNWFMPPRSPGKAIRHVVFDTNFWKTFVLSRFNAPMGASGSLTIFGKPNTPHQLFLDHLTSEFSVRTEGRGRVVDEWKNTSQNMENHWWDGVVGCAVACAMEGVSLFSDVDVKKKPISLSKVRAAAKRRAGPDKVDRDAPLSKDPVIPRPDVPDLDKSDNSGPIRLSDIKRSK